MIEPHHTAWLAAHPDRTEAWLRERTKEGFDVHHLDGDHANNDPANLVLIEHTDHMRLHGVGGNRLRAFGKGHSKPNKPRLPRRAARAVIERYLAAGGTVEGVRQATR